MADDAPSPALPSVQFGGFVPPDRAIGDYAACASFLVGGQPLFVTVSATLAAVIEGRARHPVDWLDYPPLAALGYARIAEMFDLGLSASEIPLTAEDADELLAIDRAWWIDRSADPTTH